MAKRGYRKPSIKKSISARTTGRAKRSVKSAINPTYGKKGMGWVNNPKKAMYNKVYNKTTTSAFNSSNGNTNAFNSNVDKSVSIIVGIAIVICSLPAIFIAYWVFKILFMIL